MTNVELLKKIEVVHDWTGSVVLETRELLKNEDNFTETAKAEMRNEVLNNVQLVISEMEILSFELGGM